MKNKLFSLTEIDGFMFTIIWVFANYLCQLVIFCYSHISCQNVNKVFIKKKKEICQNYMAIMLEQQETDQYLVQTHY